MIKKFPMRAARRLMEYIGVKIATSFLLIPELPVDAFENTSFRELLVANDEVEFPDKLITSGN